MRYIQYILFLSVLCMISCTSNDKREAEDIAEKFAVNYLLCQFEQASKYCNEEGVDRIRWKASSITSKDVEVLKNAEIGMTLSVDNTEVDDTLANVTFDVQNGLNADSLGHVAILSDFPIIVTLAKTDNKWRVSDVSK